MAARVLDAAGEVPKGSPSPGKGRGYIGVRWASDGDDDENEKPSTPRMVRRCTLPARAHEAADDMLRAKAELMDTWRKKIAQVEDDLAIRKPVDKPTMMRKAASVAIHQGLQGSADRYAELRLAQAERRRKVAERAAALAEHEEEMAKEQKAREEIERQKAQADEAFFTRWVQDTEENLMCVREELERERGMATQMQDEHARALSDLREAHAKELQRLQAEHAAACQKHGDELAAAQQAAAEEARRREETEADAASEKARLEAHLSDVRRSSENALDKKDREMKGAIEERDQAMLEAVQQRDKTIASIRQAHAEELGRKIVECAELVARSDLKSDRLLREHQGVQQKSASKASEFEAKLLATQAELDQTRKELEQERQAVETRLAAQAASLSAESAQQRSAILEELSSERAHAKQQGEQALKVGQLEQQLATAEEAWQRRLTEESANTAELKERHSHEINALRQENAKTLKSIQDALEKAQAMAAENQEADQQRMSKCSALEAKLSTVEGSLSEALGDLSTEREVVKRMRSEAATAEAALAGQRGALDQAQSCASLERAKVGALTQELLEARRAAAEHEQRAAERGNDAQELAEEVRRLQRQGSSMERRHAGAVGPLQLELQMVQQELADARKSAVTDLSACRSELAQARREASESALASERHRATADAAERGREQALADTRHAGEREEALRKEQAALRAQVERMAQELSAAQSLLATQQSKAASGERESADAALEILRRAHMQELARRDAEHSRALKACQAKAQEEQTEAMREIERLENEWRQKLASSQPPGWTSSALMEQVEEAERQIAETDYAWRVRLEAVEQDLRAAQEELWQERDSTRKAQADGERAVLRTIEGFWQSQFART